MLEPPKELVKEARFHAADAGALLAENPAIHPESPAKVSVTRVNGLPVASTFANAVPPLPSPFVKLQLICIFASGARIPLTPVPLPVALRQLPDWQDGNPPAEEGRRY